MLERLQKFIARLRPGVTELSCHPGLSPQSLENYIDVHREQELRTLTSPTLKTCVERNNIVLSCFSEIR